MKKYSDTTKSELLEIVKNYYSGVLKVGKITDMDEMIEFAIIHQLNALLYHMILSDKDFKDYDASKIRSLYLSSIQTNMTLQREAKKFHEYLTSNGVSHSYIKGQFIKDYYKPSEIRSMGDADIFVENGHDDIVKAYFRDNKFEITNYYEEVTSYDRGNVEFEVHDAIIWFGYDFAKRCKLTNNGYSFNDQLLMTIVHALKHIVGFGCGIRQVLDIALLLKEDNSLLCDGEFLNLIDELKISKCYNSLIGLIDKWFGTDYETTADEDAIKVLEMAIIDGGVFGKNLNDYATINTVKNKSKFKMYIRMLFPPYERMVLSYPVLRDKKYLLFAYYIKRLFTRGLKEKRYKIVSSDNVDKSTLENRENFVKLLDLEEQYYNKI